MLVLAGESPLAVQLRRSSRARRFSLRVSRIDGGATLTLPAVARAQDALAFLRQHEAWLRRVLAAMPAAPARPVGHGDTLPFEGRPHLVGPGPGRGVTLAPGRLLVPEPAPGPRLAAFLRLCARERLAEASSRHASRLGRGFTRLTLRDPRSRWGSCSAAGALMYSWRLVMAPPEVLDYVAAHEVAHLAEMNHGPGFWALVEELCPGWRTSRAWLRAEGPALHRFRFGD